jgi:hypothetical protein
MIREALGLELLLPEQNIAIEIIMLFGTQQGKTFCRPKAVVGADLQIR